MNFMSLFIYVLCRQSRRDQRIYLNHEANVSVENENYILHCLPSKFYFVIVSKHSLRKN